MEEHYPLSFSVSLNYFKRNLSPDIRLDHTWLTFVIKVEKRLKLEKEMDIGRLLITEVEEKSSPDTSQVNKNNSFILTFKIISFYRFQNRKDLLKQIERSCITI